MFNSQPYCWVQPITSVEPMLMLGCHISVTCNNCTSDQASIDSFLDLLIFYVALVVDAWTVPQSACFELY